MVKEKTRSIKLSEKELSVLKYLAAGWIDSEISNELSISLIGVRTAIRRACEKTATSTRCALVSWGYKNKIL